MIFQGNAKENSEPPALKNNKNPNFKHQIIYPVK
jgi:hypothetical protein